MKILKYLLIGVLALIALALITAAFLPKTFHAEGNTTVNVAAQEVYDYVKFLHTQEDYTVWFAADSNIIKQYTNDNGVVGATLVWKSKVVGDGKQVIRNLVPNKRVEIDLHLMDENSEAANYYYDITPISTGTSQVKLAVDGNMPYPFNIMQLFYDMNKDFQTNANNLKNKLEIKANN